MGRALAPLRALGVAVVASGSITHNQGEFQCSSLRAASWSELADCLKAALRRRREACGAPVAPFSAAFDAWAKAVTTGQAGLARAASLAAYRSQDQATLAHPDPSHFVPLLVAAGAAGDSAGTVIHSNCSQYSLSMTAFAFH